MNVTPVGHSAPALWLYRALDPDGQLHRIVVYGVPSVFPRGPYAHSGGVEEGPPPRRLRMWGNHSWYEVTVDGDWADLSGHEAYATHAGALDAALERLSS